MMVLDHIFSSELKTVFDEHKIPYQIVVQHKHRKNLAEHSIQTYKSHFKTGLAGIYLDFPMSEWDHMIPQSNITLNLLRLSRVNPKISAYACIREAFNFIDTPMALLGSRVIMHTHPDNRASWKLNSQHH